SSIRTAPGFRLVDFGLPLGTVAALLILKYALPWLVILGAALPSLIRAGRPVVCHAIDLIMLGYAARFAVVAAVIDPLRRLPNGLDGIVGMFCVTWAEFLTFTVAAAGVLALTWSHTTVRRTAAQDELPRETDTVVQPAERLVAM